MSGVYIKGMEMPTGCSGCPIDSDICTLWQELPPERLRDTRPAECPLVTVPPHGRLVDADALLSQYKGNVWTAQTDYAEGLRDVVKDIADAPTIIPAEEAEP